MKCERPVYYPGNQVNGKIYLRVEQPMNAAKLDIQVQGSEKVYYVTHHTKKKKRSKTKPSGGKGKNKKKKKTVHYTKKHNMGNKLINFCSQLYEFAGPLNPGDYSFAFDFILPANLPASMMVWFPQEKHHAKAAVKYNIEATVTNHDHSVLKFETLLLIQEPPVPFNPNNLVME